MFGILFVTVCSTSALAVVRGTYLYSLSNFTGTIRYDWVTPFYDRERNEIYVTNGGDRSIRIFNDSGMELYNFGDDETLNGMREAVVDEEGNILILTMRYEGGRPEHRIIRCNYRGEPTSTVEMKGLPPEFSNFVPHRLVYRNGSLYLADLASMKIIVTEPDGQFKKGYDVAKLMGLNEQQKSDSGMVGFYVALDGNIFFTVPVYFKAFKLSPDGQILEFGKKGSAPGRFNIVAGIASDDKGYIYVVDKLRSVVIIFDKEFKFQSEFGYRGFRPGNLLAPDQIEVDGKGRVYVTQMGRRGVSVFQVKYD